MVGAGGSTFEDLLEITEPDLREIVVCARDAVLEVDPDAVQVVRLGDRAITFGVGPKKMSEGYCYVLPYDSWVNLGFYRGVGLPDPQDLLEGTGAKMRHVKLRTKADCKRDAVADLIRAALAERREALNR